jgi:hypothetical protein
MKIDLKSLKDRELLDLLEAVSAELKERNLLLSVLGGKSREDAVQGIADALLGRSR